MEQMILNPYAQWEDKADNLIPTATLQIYDEIGEYLKGEENGNIFRASAASMCVRRRWYQKNGYKGLPLTPRKIVNFLLGDLSERTLLHFIKRGCVGSGRLYSEVIFGETLGSIQFQKRDIEIYKQRTLSFKLGELTITGHADGFGKRNVDGKWELIEIKSAADYGFKEFQEKGAGDYLKQSHALMLTEEARALDIKSVRFFYLKKQTGHVWDRKFDFNPEIAETVKSEFIMTDNQVPPPAPYDFIPETFRGKPTGRKTIPWQCGYCSMRDHCKPGARIEWKKDQFGTMKPIYLYEEEKWISQENKNQSQVDAF